MRSKKFLLLASVTLLVASCGGSKTSSSVLTSTLTTSEGTTSLSSNTSISSSDTTSASSTTSNTSTSKSTASTTSNTSTKTSSSSVNNKVTITVTNGTGSGEYIIGAMVTVDCTVPEGYEFECWKEGDTVVSKAKQYSFLASRDITLTASFVEISKEFSDVSAIKTYLNSIEENVISKTLTSTYKIVDNKVSNEYKDIEEYYAKNYYSNALKVEGYQKDSSYSFGKQINIEEYYANIENKNYHVRKYDPSDATFVSFAKKKNIVSEVNDGDKEILSSVAAEQIENNIIETLSNSLTSMYSVNKDVFEQNISGDIDEITLSSHIIEGNFYIQNDLFFKLDLENNIVIEAKAEANYYVRATSLDEQGALKDDAVATKKKVEEYAFTYGEQVVLPSEVNLDSYFISSFDVSAQYYDRNAYRSFSKDFLFLPLEATISTYNFNIVKESVLPTTACEELKIASITSSNESIIKVEKSNILTLAAGKANLTFTTTQGATCTYEVEVKALAPSSITIKCEDAVVEGEKIELTAEIAPITASKDLIWSTSNAEIAAIVNENNKVYLEGKKQGSVVITAKSRLDNSILATKTVNVTKGALDVNSLREALVGTWINKYDFSTDPHFTFTFNDDGTFTLLDTYRSNAAKFTSAGNYTITSTLDTEIAHTGTYVKDNADYYYIEVTNLRLTGDNASTYFFEMHIAIKSDGTKLMAHCKGGTSSDLSKTNTLQYEFSKEA